DRAKLSEIVFADEAQRKRLNSILHPFIIAAQDAQLRDWMNGCRMEFNRLNSILHPFIIAAQDAQLRDWEQQDPKGIAVVDAALMIESGGYQRFDKLIVVHCRPEVQLQRLMQRNKF